MWYTYNNLIGLGGCQAHLAGQRHWCFFTVFLFFSLYNAEMTAPFVVDILLQSVIVYGNP